MYGAPAAESERSGSREVVRVQVRVEHVLDPEPSQLRCPQVELGRLDGIDHCAGLFPPTAEQVRNGDGRIGMKELTKDHLALPERFKPRM